MEKKTAAWMIDNKESIFGSRPWKIFGEGPASETAVPLQTKDFNEGKGKPFGPEDIRFTAKNNTVYVFALDLAAGEQAADKKYGKKVALIL